MGGAIYPSWARYHLTASPRRLHSHYTPLSADCWPRSRATAKSDVFEVARRLKQQGGNSRSLTCGVLLQSRLICQAAGPAEERLCRIIANAKGCYEQDSEISIWSRCKRYVGIKSTSSGLNHWLALGGMGMLHTCSNSSFSPQRGCFAGSYLYEVA